MRFRISAPLPNARRTYRRHSSLPVALATVALATVALATVALATAAHPTPYRTPVSRPGP